MGAKEMLTHCWTRISVALLCVLTGTALGATPAQKCAATKTKAAGAKVYAKATCYQKALAKGSTIDSTCLTKAEQKFVAAFVGAEAKGGCAVTGDSAAVEALVDTCVASLTGAIAGDAKCAAAKMKAVGTTTYAKTKCHQKSLLKGLALDTPCLDKAEPKFTTAVAKADGLGTCADTATALEALVDECVGSLGNATLPAFQCPCWAGAPAQSLAAEITIPTKTAALECVIAPFTEKGGGYVAVSGQETEATVPEYAYTSAEDPFGFGFQYKCGLVTTSAVLELALTYPDFQTCEAELVSTTSLIPWCNPSP